MSVFDHLSIRVANFAKSEGFYREALAALGIAQLFSVSRSDGHVAGFGRDRASFFIADGQGPQGVSHLAFSAGSHAEVEAFHKIALTVGGRDNGAPGLRPQYHAGYYAAFVLDPDGNNIEAVFHGVEEPTITGA